MVEDRYIIVLSEGTMHIYDMLVPFPVNIIIKAFYLGKLNNYHLKNLLLPTVLKSIELYHIYYTIVPS